MKYFDAFSGYGGFHLGIERAYEDIKSGEHIPERWTSGCRDKRRWYISNDSFWETRGDSEYATCIGYSEIDKYAGAVYKYHFGGKDGDNSNQQSAKIEQNRQRGDRNTDEKTTDVLPTSRTATLHNGGQYARNFGDITKIDPTTIPDFDLFVGGFPCQAFSIAGKRGGFDDTRGTLIYDVFRILKEKQPRFVLLENVKGLLSHDSGRTFKVIVSALAELGYAIEWQVLNAKNFGVPQNRERVFIIGHLGGFGEQQVFPIRGDEQENTNQCHPTVDANYYKGQSNQRRLIYKGAIMSEKNKEWINDGKQHSRNFPQGQRVYSTEGISSTISSQAGGHFPQRCAAGNAHTVARTARHQVPAVSDPH
jgi:DNA (cytosine-5)-methyltransferase 1